METLEFEVRDGIGVITLNRPKALNALNSQLLNELASVLSELLDVDVQALILTGSGDRAFAAGADISEMAEFTAQEAEAFSAGGQAVFEMLETFPVPTIAAVKGFALGGGCELAMACDLVLAAPTAVFGQPEVKLGVIPGFGGTQRLARRVGRQRALELMLTGRNVDAAEAARIGLVLDVIEDGDVMAAAHKLADRIARNGPSALRWVKQVVHETEGRDSEAAMAAERAHFALCFSTQDQKEGMAAFLEKRRAEFTGL
jgi:enoyl-CoA hydratase